MADALRAGRADEAQSLSGQTILIVEDEPDIAELLSYNLEKEGLSVSVETRGDTALESIRAQPPDLIVLDLMLPGMSGLELARLIQRDPKTADVPIVMLTAKSAEIDRIVGLELGADDYITKPFSPREVVLRVQGVLRRLRASRNEEAELLEAGEIRLDVNAYRVEVGGEEVRLTATEFRLLRTLLDRCGRVQTRAQLLSDVWGYSDDVDSRTVDTHLRRLRRKLGPEASRIETVVGVGYRLRC